MDPAGMYILVGVIIVIFIILIRGFRIVPQSKAYVIQRLGSYHTTWQTGVHFLLPIFDKIVQVVTLKEQVVDFPPQDVITKDNVTMQIDTIVFFQITEPRLYTYGIDRPITAIENLSATTLRNIIGEMELDHTLTSRDTINSKIRIILDEATDPWGIKVTRVELKNILPPREIREAMEKQMKAERERRAVILAAEGEKESKLLRADADKEAKIKEAEGEAIALKTVNEAKAAAIRCINEANPGEGYLMLQKLEALAKVADGNATKVILPSDIAGVASLVEGIKQTTK